MHSFTFVSVHCFGQFPNRCASVSASPGKIHPSSTQRPSCYCLKAPATSLDYCASLSVILSFLGCCVSGITHPKTDFSFTVASLRPIKVVVCVSNLFLFVVEEYPTNGCYLLNYSPIGGIIDGIINKTIVNICIMVFV